MTTDSNNARARRYRWTRELTPQQYADGLNSIADRMTDVQRRLLVAQYHAPDRTVFATKLAQLAGVTGGHPGVNSQYGRLGHMFVDATGYQPDFRGDQTPRWWSVFSQGEKKPKGFVWEMLPEVAGALELLGWVAPGITPVPGLDLERESASERGRNNKGGPSFEQDAAFEMIAAMIVRAQPDVDGFVTHRAIVEELVSSPVGSTMIAETRAKASWPDDRSAASNMVAWFSQQITVARSPWAEFFDRERRDGTWAYRPRTAVRAPIAPDPELSAIEGEPRMFFHVRRERDPALAEAKRQAVLATMGALACEACGFAVPQSYPGLGAEICEVHHRHPLADVVNERRTRLEDLAVLCPNCHRAIHRSQPMLTVEEFRLKFFESCKPKAG